jgi:hypothetical protein
MNRKRALLIAIGVIFIATLSCTESEQAPIGTAVAQAGQTVIAEGEKAAQTQAAILLATAKAAAATQAATLVEGAGEWAATQAAAALQTAEAAILSDTPTPAQTPIPGTPNLVVQPPFASCSGKSDGACTPPGSAQETLEKGACIVKYTCDAGRGVVNHSLFLFGGKQGSILKPPTFKVEVSSGMDIIYTPSQSGRLKIVAELSTNGKTGAAAGSGIMLKDPGEILVDALLPDIVGAILDISTALIFEPAAGIRTDAYVYVDANGAHEEATSQVKGHGYAASFPIPPWAMTDNLVDEPVTVTLTTPVNAGTRYHIQVGIRTSGSVYGYAFAWWNVLNKQDTFIRSVSLTEEK